jgi:transposase
VLPRQVLFAHDVGRQALGSIVAISAPLPMSHLEGEALCGSLQVRKWICREASCSQYIFAERFPELVQRYARMTDRLVKVLQALGVTTNGTDAAQIASSLGMPTTAKTIIRRVLQLPLPSEGEVEKVGIDEWAWKKGQRYGTILVDLKKRRIVQLLAERSVETSTAWLRTHLEIDLVSRDRGKIFREAATDGAPQANQVVDRFHATRRTLLKPWRSSFASRNTCSKR